jgi:hypothetical protein
MAGAAERELDHAGLARDDAELAPQGLFLALILTIF